MRIEGIWGLRLLAQPRFTRRVQGLILVLVVGYYVVWSVTQLVVIQPLDFQHDFLDYYRAANFAVHGQGVYSDFLHFWGTEHWAIAYIYPPLLAITLIPLAGLPVEVAGRLWLLGIHLSFLAALLLIFAVQPRLSRAAKVTIALLFYLFLPVYLTLKFQQVAALWLLLLAAVLWAYQRRRLGWCALFVALAASLKVIPVLLILFFLRKRAFRLVTLSVVTLGLLSLGEIVAVPDGVLYGTRVLPTIGLGTSNRDNASVNGLLSRVIEIYPQASGPFPAKGVAAALVLLAIAAFLAITLRAVASGPVGEPVRGLEFALFVAVLPIISSVSWQHHLVTLLLPISLLVGYHYTRRGRPPWQVGALGVAYLLIWVDWRLFGLSDPDPHGWTGAAVLLATSFRLIGMVVLWGLLLHLVRQARARAALTDPLARAA